MRYLFVLTFVGAGLGAPLLASTACSSTPPATSVRDASDDRGRLSAPVTIDAGACQATVWSPPLLDSPHVEIGTPVTYNSNPPSSGPHYPIWAAFKEFEAPVDRRYYVHDLEHGAVVLLYKCQSATECPEIVKELRTVIAGLPSDPLCGGAVRVRAVLVPDPLLDKKVAVAAWGWTYQADCVDVPSLSKFARDNYGKGPEALCADGQTEF